MSADTPGRTDELQGDIVHVYDGIEEADNRLPLWWLWTFYAAIIFGTGYWLFYEGFHFGKNPNETYNAARMAALDTGEPVTKEELVAMKDDKQAVKDGQKIFKRSCTRCHGNRGEGKIGPNLTDANWIGGGGPLDIFNTVNRGRGGKGMQAWGPTYGRGGVMTVTAFLMTIQNTNVAGKAPEGPVWTPPPVEEPEPEPEDGPDGGADGGADAAKEPATP